MWRRLALGLVVLLAATCPPAGQSTARAAASPGPVEADEADLRSGLQAVYRTLAGDHVAALERVDAKPAFTWGRSSPHPRVRPGPFEVVWTGLIVWQDAGTVRFGAYLGGEITVAVDGVTVLHGRSDRPTGWVDGTAPLERPAGLYRVHVRYRSLPGVPARVQLAWEGPGFSREPVPAVRLKHLATEVTGGVRAHDEAERGRIAAGQLGCARCHRGAFPTALDPPPGPSLVDLGRRVRRGWLLDWLADPRRVRADAHMPVLFASDRTGFVERWLVAEYLSGPGENPVGQTGGRPGDHRQGREGFLGLGCAACHLVPDVERDRAATDGRTPLRGLNDRADPPYLADFLRQPDTRYPDGRMPRLPMTPERARDIAAYLLMWSTPARAETAAGPAMPHEIDAVSRRLGVTGLAATGRALVREKGCARCHPSLGDLETANVPIAEPKAIADGRGCLAAGALPHVAADPATRRSLAAFAAAARLESHPSAFEDGQRQLRHAGCFRCHQHDGDQPPQIEQIGRTLWSSHLARLPFQRTPPLTNACAKYTRAYLAAAVRDGVTGIRPTWYSYKMPAFGTRAEALVRALAAGDGDLPDAADELTTPLTDPTLFTVGPSLVGFEGYACVACHVWNGQSLSEVEPGTVGPDLTTVTRRIRRSWFDRWLDNPLRVHPGTPMPAIFHKGEPAPLRAVLEGNAARQKDAIWAYLARGKDAPSPKPRPPLPIAVAQGEPPLVAQVPIRPPEGKPVEALAVLVDSQDLLLYDVGRLAVANVYTGAAILRHGTGWRSFGLEGRPLAPTLAVEPALVLAGPGPTETAAGQFLAYDRLPHGVRVRTRWPFPSGTVATSEELTLDARTRQVTCTFHFAGVPAGRQVEIRMAVPAGVQVRVTSTRGPGRTRSAGGTLTAGFGPAADGNEAAGVITLKLPPASKPPRRPPLVPVPPAGTAAEAENGGSRPGYRVVCYPRPKTATGEDRVMPAALAIDPRTGRVFLASVKLGELLVLRDPRDGGPGATFENYAHGLFQEAYGMAHDGEALYVLHRRNLTRIRETAGVAEHFDRVAALPHAVADTYDWGYGLVRDARGRFVFTFAPYGDPKLIGAGNALRVTPRPGGARFEEIAYGFRNPFGWCAGPDGEIFFTDNQGDWVATNRLCHLVEGRHFGYPNRARPDLARRPAAPAATVWVPYGWARSINGVAYDNTGGKFGPFAGQFFLAELMNGGAIVRASLERVNGVYQGACFPFWGKGLLGPLVLAFDPRGRLYVGSITQPGWMGQPDRGALYRIDYTGDVPFEIQSIHVRPDGFRLRFTAPVDRAAAASVGAYQVEHYRYEYTGAYGSPELDRTRVPVTRVTLAADGLSAELTTGPLLKGRVYAITAGGVRSPRGEPLAHPTGVYTLNELPER